MILDATFTDDPIQFNATFGDNATSTRLIAQSVSETKVYALSSSSTSKPGAWEDTPPAPTTEKPYLWCKTTLKFTTEDGQVYSFSDNGIIVGLPGYTPQKGTDYFTSSEVTAILNDCKSYTDSILKNWKNVYEYRSLADDAAIDAFLQEQISDTTFSAGNRNLVIYATTNGTTLVYGRLWMIEIFKSSSTYGIVTAKSYRDNGVITLSRAWMNGTMQDWEWENPPMEPGVEYRTTERYNRKVVYRKSVVVDLEAISSSSSSTSTSVPHGITKFSEHVSSYAHKGNFVFPYFSEYGGSVSVSSISSQNINLRINNTNMSAGTWSFDIKYTKTS